jgi:hypothetical protein
MKSVYSWLFYSNSVENCMLLRIQFYNDLLLTQLPRVEVDYNNLNIEIQSIDFIPNHRLPITPGSK